MKWSIIILAILLIPTIVGTSLADRPDYPFSDDVFSELEPFPDDFYDIKTLFATQMITASHLSSSYYQPELLPLWNITATDIYGTDKIHANQGIFLYPSRFDIYNLPVDDSLTLSTLIYAYPGVSTYQGTEIYFTYDDTLVDITLTDSVFVLSPTYPIFKQDWMQVLEYKITVLGDYEEITINIREHDPPYSFSQEMKREYGLDMYSDCRSILSENTNLCTIHLHSQTSITDQITQDNNTLISCITLSTIAIMITIISLWLKHVRKQRKKPQ